MASFKPKFAVGERVLCFEPDQTKARVLYDAKILDVDFVKEGKARKETEYKIHFQGWNSAWDRWANESFVLKNTEDNKKLQRKLARRAIKQLRNHGRRKVYLPGVAASIKNCPSSSDSDSSLDDSLACMIMDHTRPQDVGVPSLDKRRRKKSMTSISKPTEEVPSEAVDVADVVMQRKSNPFDFPDVLKQRLLEDNETVTKRGMVVKLPSQLNIVQILENFVKYFAFHIAKLPSSEKRMKSNSAWSDVIPPDKSLNLCKETCENIRILFDFTLPVVLLYNNEKSQLTSLGDVVLKDEEGVGHVDPGRVNPTSSVDDFSSGFDGLSPENTSLPPKRRHVEPRSPRGVPHHRKTAEEQIIEETHTYLIPHQPNLDRTGLANDAQGRRRSSRLSQHLHSPDRNDDDEELPASPGFEENSSKNRGCRFVSLATRVFIRPPTINHIHGNKRERGSLPPFPLLLREADRHSCWSSSIKFNQMCQDVYIASAGDDIKKALSLHQAWKFRLFPTAFSPPEGAGVPYSLVYGIQHLLRLFVKLPDIFSKMEIPEYKQKIIYKHVQLLLRFLADHDREVSSLSSAYVDMAS